MKRVIIESPYGGDTAANEAYARRALRDSIERGEAPIASHLLFTQVLDDTDPDQRRKGIRLGLTWAEKGDLTAVYADLGISEGMREGIYHAEVLKRRVEIRYLDGVPEDKKKKRRS